MMSLLYFTLGQAMLCVLSKPGASTNEWSAADAVLAKIGPASGKLCSLSRWHYPFGIVLLYPLIKGPARCCERNGCASGQDECIG
jgi:hypothetical protein